jgi:hypothetical protein
MAVREIVDLILWDDDKGAFNLDWLPRTAMGALRELCVLQLLRLCLLIARPSPGDAHAVFVSVLCRYTRPGHESERWFALLQVLQLLTASA